MSARSTGGFSRRVIHIANTNPKPVYFRHSSTRSKLVYSSDTDDFSAGSAISRAQSDVSSIAERFGWAERHSGANPKNSRKSIFVKQTDVRGDASSETVGTSSSGVLRVASRTLRRRS